MLTGQQCGASGMHYLRWQLEVVLLVGGPEEGRGDCGGEGGNAGCILPPATHWARHNCWQRLDVAVDALAVRNVLQHDLHTGPQAVISSAVRQGYDHWYSTAMDAWDANVDAPVVCVQGNMNNNVTNKHGYQHRESVHDSTSEEITQAARAASIHVWHQLLHRLGSLHKPGIGLAQAGVFSAVNLPRSCAGLHLQSAASTAQAS